VASLDAGDYVGARKMKNSIILAVSALFFTSCSGGSQDMERMTPLDIYLNSTKTGTEKISEPENIVDIINNLENEKFAVVLVLNKGCGAAAKFFPILDEVKKNIEEKGGRYILIDSEVMFESDDITTKIVTWMRTTFGENMVPTGAVYKHGQLVDFFQGSSNGEDEIPLTHMMYRNGIMDDFPGYVSKVENFGSIGKVKAEKRIKFLRVVDAYDFRGEDLSDMNLENGVYNGSDFSNANMANTSFDRSTFFNSNLCGANLKGASMMATLWKNTTCPDGSNSNYNGDTCVYNTKMSRSCIDVDSEEIID
jgi:thiol-disulfide isomerase/thioredoxin